MDINNVLSEIFKTVFSVDDINDELSSETVSQWDSIGHLTMISELEGKLGVQFTIDEVEEMVTVKAIKSVLDRYGMKG